MCDSTRFLSSRRNHNLSEALRCVADPRLRDEIGHKRLCRICTSLVHFENHKRSFGPQRRTAREDAGQLSHFRTHSLAYGSKWTGYGIQRRVSREIELWKKTAGCPAR